MSYNDIAIESCFMVTLVLNHLAIFVNLGQIQIIYVIVK